ncbi:MAG: hypothetical protein F9K23_12840 [Bacteroidetes bacterium]|nr:MAG: hypothetical protein F9K23_12840 [Bacteroidota bacterium]
MLQFYLKPLLFLFFSSVLLSSCSPTIKRWGIGVSEMKDQSVTYKPQQNIFKDYGWTRPNIASEKISFSNGSTQINWAGQNYALVQKDSNTLALVSSTGADTLVSEEKLSAKDIYYNRSILNIITIQRERWVSHTSYESKSVPVQRSRQVSYQTYNYSTKSYTTQYRTEHYTSYEYRMVPVTTWRWETYTEQDVEIPAYKYYGFKVGDTYLLVYKITVGEEFEYYVQNAGYLIGLDKDKLNYVGIDVNSNGLYNDEIDQIMFNSWNPYSKSSSYVKPKVSFLENFWLPYNKLENDYMVKIEHIDNEFSFLYENNRFYKNKKKGRVKFTNVPKTASLVANGKTYKIKNNKRYKIQYGKYKIKITRPGYMDYEQSILVDVYSENHTVNYDSVGRSGVVIIENIFLGSYFVTVTSENGYSKTEFNATYLNVPIGKNKIKIYDGGVSYEYEVDVSAYGKTTIDFEAELKKLKSEEAPSSEEEKQNETTPAEE